MKKLLYFNLQYSFYSNKINAQIKSFSNLGLQTYLATTKKEDGEEYLCFLNYGANEFYEVKRIVLSKNGKTSTFQKYKIISREVLAYFKENHFNYCYIRRLSKDSLFLVNMIKNMSKNGDVLYEWPTVPLDKYAEHWKNIMQYFEVLFYNVFIRKYIKKEIVILQNDIKEDKKYYEISNAIDSSKFDNEFSNPKDNSTVVFVGIAHLLKWHGYDRILYSLANYKGNRKIQVKIVSTENKEVLRLKQLSEKLGINDKVTFINQLRFDEIKQLVKQCNIGIGSLGYHRRGAKYDTSIKNKEYCAFGLPFICSCEDRSFPSDYPYAFKVSSDEEIFDLESIINWYDTLERETYQKEMYEYAKANLSFEKYYKNLFKELEDE